jgi:hypothetical protein
MKKKHLLISCAIIILFLLLLVCILKKENNKKISYTVESIKINRLNYNITHTITDKDKIASIVELINSATKTNKAINKEVPYIYLITLNDKNSNIYNFYVYDQNGKYYIKNKNDTIWLSNKKLFTLLESVFLE